MEIIVEFFLYEITYKISYSDVVVDKFGVQLGFGLISENRINNSYTYSPHHRLSHIRRVVVFFKIFFYGSCYCFSECREVCPPLSGILSIYKRRDIFPGTFSVSNYKLNIVTGQVDWGIERLRAKVVIDQVEKSVFGFILCSVEFQKKTGVQVGVVLHHRFD